MAALTEDTVLKKARTSKLQYIKTLNCWGCKLQNVAIVQDIPNLEVAGMSGNEIKTLKFFSSCVNLKELYVRKNCISDIEEVLHLQQLENLRNLWINENPIAMVSGYRNYIIKALPQLTRLDNKDVTDSERGAVADLTLDEILSSNPIEKDKTSKDLNRTESEKQRDSQKIKIKIKKKTKTPRITDEGWNSQKQLSDPVEKKMKEKEGRKDSCIFIQSSLQVSAPVCDAVLKLLPVLDTESLLHIKNTIEELLSQN